MARSRLWTPLGLALLCSHCALTALLAGVGVLGLGSLPFLGVDINYVWPPVLILGGFALFLWSGRPREGEACEAPLR